MTFINLLELVKNSIIFTPNERLNRRLHKLYGEQSRAQGLGAWAAPPIFSWTTGLQQLYQAAIEQGYLTKVLLSDFQYRQLWYQVIDKVLDGHDFLQPRQTAIEMLKAWQVLKQWRIDYHEVAAYSTKEAALLVTCIAEVAKLLQKNQWLVADELPDHLAKLIIAPLLAQMKAAPTNKIILFGFDEMPPQSQAFCETLKSQGLMVESLDWHYPSIVREQHALPGIEEEYRTMAYWAKTQLKHGQQQIACIAPDLTHSRALLARVFYETFHPDALFEPYATSPYFNISGGEYLADLPLFQTLFNFLDLFAAQIDYSVLNNLLLSPFIAQAETEKLARVAVDLCLRNKLLQTIHYHDVPLDILNEQVPAFSQLWQNVIARDPKQQIRPPSGWIEWLNALLQVLGWPGERIVNSAEYQQLTQWHSVMANLVTLDAFCKQLTYKQFVELLKEALNNVPFEIKTNDAPVQILGALEAAGSIFDCIWVSGLTDKNWPPVVKANAYIPFDMQRRLNMPHSSSQRQYEYSRNMMQRWINSSKEIHFSYAQYEGDQPFSPSPLLIDYAPELIAIDVPTKLLPIKNQQENIEEKAYLPFMPDENDKPFSVSLFEQQINCPFQAFAKQRLHSNEFSHPQTSWDPRLRGTNLHAVMEKLWRRWQNLDHLKQLSPEQLHQQVDEAVVQVLKRNMPSLSRRPDYFKLEKSRLIHIVHDWLITEKKRMPFKVAEIEYTQHYRIDNLNIKLRIDRIDLTDAGEWVLIDYKTNTQNINEWFGEKPTKPQMPIYSCAFNQVFDVITYACMHPSEQKMKFLGIARQEISFPDITPINKMTDEWFSSWETLLSHWQTQINFIAQDFIKGDLRIKPRNNNTCEYCHLASLCRINDR